MCFKILLVFVVIPQQCVTVKCFICQLHSRPQTALGLAGDFTVAFFFFSCIPPCQPVAGVESSQLYQLHYGNENTLTRSSEDQAHYPAGTSRSCSDSDGTGELLKASRGQGCAPLETLKNSITQFRRFVCIRFRLKMGVSYFNSFRPEELESNFSSCVMIKPSEEIHSRC